MVKMWYHPRFNSYYPTKPWWEEPNKLNDELIEVEINKEELIVEGGSQDPENHAGRWETEWYEARFEHQMLNKIPWPYGKYKITIEPIVEERDKNELD